MTEKTVFGLSMQQAYETMRSGLIAQGQPATDQNGKCRYRTARGLKCAVGMLIPDHAYTTKIEGDGGWDALRYIDPGLPEYGGDFTGLVCFAQGWHDTSEAGEPLDISGLDAIAVRYGLAVPVE